MNTGENQIDFDNDQAPLKKDTLQGTGQAKAVRGYVIANQDYSTNICILII